jgi:F-type H+-transporting ATPase subunit b
MEKQEHVKLIFGTEYYTIDDLRYNQKLGFLFSKDEMAQFLKEKNNLIEDKNERIEVLPLKTFNSRYCFYVKGKYLFNNYIQYLTTFVEDLKLNQKTLFERNADDIIMARAFSEIEGTLNVENVPTTHKKVKDIYQKKALTDKNDIIVKNMIDARQKEVDDMYSDAEKSKTDAALLKTEYEERLEKANEESEEILKNAVRKAQLREEEIIKNAGEEAKRALERAREEAELEKKRALNEIKDEVSEMALGIAAAVIEREVSDSEHASLIDDFIRDMGDTK